VVIITVATLSYINTRGSQQA